MPSATRAISTRHRLPPTAFLGSIDAQNSLLNGSNNSLRFTERDERPHVLHYVTPRDVWAIEIVIVTLCDGFVFHPYVYRNPRSVRHRLFPRTAF